MKSETSMSESILEKLDEIEVKLEYAKNRLGDFILTKRKQNAEMAQWLEKMKVQKQHAIISL
jgi:hypothetical protein